MKKTKLISIVLSVLMLASLFSINASAVTVKSGTLYTAGQDTYENLLNRRLEDTTESLNKYANASPYKFYNNLTPAAKVVYNAIIAAKAGLNCSPKGTFTVEIPAKYGCNSEDALFDCFFTAMIAVVDDAPELYWTLGVPFNVDYDVKANNDIILYFDLDLEYTPYNSYSELENEYKQTVQAAKNVDVQGTTRYEKVKDITEELCDIADYADITGDETEKTSKIFFPSSALLYPYDTVCDGYAKAFKMICDENNIPCIIVVGESIVYDEYGRPQKGGHAWNYVLMDDRKWYAVDTTWLDSYYTYSGELCFYFLAGANTLNDREDSFSYTHIADGIRYLDYPVSYPVLNTSSYNPSNAAPDVPMIPEPYPYPVPDPKPVYDSLKYGDVNGDGKISVIDAKWILQSVTGNRNFDIVQRTVADVNKDGKVSVVDAKWILQAVSGLRVLSGTPVVDVPMYEEYNTVPDLGAYYGINCVDKIFYEDGAVEYYYANDDLMIDSSQKGYPELLAEYGFIYDSSDYEDGYLYDYYINYRTGTGVTLCIDKNDVYGVSSVYMYVYSI